MLAYTLAEHMFGKSIPQDTPMDKMEFQDQAVDKLMKVKKHILGLPMGAGKSVVGVRTLAGWNANRVLIVATERAILSWLKSMWCWYPDMLRQYAIIGGGAKYDAATRQDYYRKYRKHPNLKVITNWALLQRDFKALGEKEFPTDWDVIVTDEHHKFLRNRDNKIHKIMKGLDSQRLLMVTGSAMSKGPQDLWVPLNIMDRKLFSSYWRYVGTWCQIFDGPHGKTIGPAKNIENFKKFVRGPYAIIATKKELGLQKKLRSIEPVQMEDAQETAYEAIRDDLLLELEDGPPLILLNTLATYTKLRQMAACPAIISPSLGIGGNMLRIQEMLLDLPVEERHSVIFTPFRDGVPYIKAFLEGRGTQVGLPYDGEHIGVPVYQFMGGMSMQQLFEDLQTWKKTGGIAVCTIQYAESFDMETTDKGFMCGYEWDPQVNFQAEDRIDRANNPHGLINIYYMMLQNSLDEDVLYTLVTKQTNVNQLYSNRAVIQQALKRD